MASVAVLEVTASGLRLATFSIRKKQYTCLNCRDVPFPADQPWADSLTQAAMELKDEFSKHDTLGVVLPIEKTIYRKLMMPFASEAQIDQTIAYSLEEFLGGAVENYAICYRRESASSKQKQNKQLIECLCCEKAMITPLFDLLLKEGVRPAIISASTIAASNIFPLENKPAVLLEIYNNRAEVSCFNGMQFSGGRAFTYKAETLQAELKRTLLSLNVAADTPVYCTQNTKDYLRGEEYTPLPIPTPEADTPSKVTAPLYGMAKVLLENRESTLNLCTGEFAPPGALQKMAPVLMVCSILFMALLLVPFIKVYRDRTNQEKTLSGLKKQRDTLFYDCFPSAPPDRYPEEQEKMFLNALTKMSAHRSKNTGAATSALKSWLIFYQALPNNRQNPKWWMTQLDARDDELAMTIKAAKYEMGWALLYAALQKDRYHVSLDNLHRLDEQNVTFILKAKKKKEGE